MLSSHLAHSRSSVAWGMTGATSPLLKAVPPSKGGRARPSWPGRFIRQPEWILEKPEVSLLLSTRGRNAGRAARLSGPAGSPSLHLAQVPLGASQGPTGPRSQPFTAAPTAPMCTPGRGCAAFGWDPAELHPTSRRRRLGRASPSLRARVPVS